MKKIIIATLFAVLATTNVLAVKIDDDYSYANIDKSVQDDRVEEDDDFFACSDSNVFAPTVTEEDWASYLSKHSGKIAAGAIVAAVVVGGIYYFPIYLSGTAATSLMGKGYYAIFAMAGYAPKVIEKIVEVEKEVERVVFLGGGTEYVEVPVQVPVTVTEYVGVQSQKAFEAAMNMAAKHFGYSLSAYSADGISHEARFRPRNWERMVTLATGYLSNPDGGLGSLRNGK